MLPSKLHYQSKVEPAMAKSFRSNIQPQNGTGPYNPNDTITFNLPTHNNLCFVPNESYLNFKATITNGATAGNYIRLDSNGAHGFIRRIRVFHGTNLLEDIENYEVLAKMMFDLQAPYTATQGKLSITTGTRADLSLNMPIINRNAFTDTDPTQIQLASAFNAIPSKVTIPNHGALLNSGTSAIAAAAVITTQLYSINLISIIGTLCNEKYFPLFACTSAPLRVEIQLVPNLLNAVACDQDDISFTIKDVEYVMNTIELSDSAMGIIQNSLNGEPLQFCVTDYKNYVWNGQLPNAATSFSVPINAKFSSLKSIIIASRDTAKAGNKEYFPCSSNSFSLSQYYFRIGANVFPAKYPSSTSEYFSEVMKATGSISSMQHCPAIDIESYSQTLPTKNNDSFKAAAAGAFPGVDTYKFSSVSSGSFYTGMDLENYATADRTNIFAGYNSNTDDIFYVPSYPTQTAIGNLRFDAFAMYDCVLVFQNNTVYCKF